MNKPFRNIKRNQGISLVIALVFLFVSTLIGLSALKTSLLNEKMTLNTVQREQALEAAEAALLAGEEFIQNNTDAIINAVITSDFSAQTRIVSPAASTCTAFNGGICAPKEFTDSTKFDNWVDIDGDTKSLEAWTTVGRHRVLTDEITNQYDLNTSPKYIIEFMGYIRNAGTSGDSSCTNPSEIWQLNNWPYCSLDPSQFRVTAFATSGNFDQTRVMLQTTYVVN